MTTTKSSPANRGKSTEKAVTEFLKKLNVRADTAFLRFPDARSAQGFLAAQPADMLIVSKGVSIFLEIKHLNHPYRLPKAGLRQHTLLNKFAEAGAKTYVLVEHEGLGWRIVPTRALEFGVPSWDLSGLGLFTSAENALVATGLF